MLKDKLHFLNLLKFLSCIPIIFLHYGEHFLTALGVDNPYQQYTVMGFLTRNTGCFVEFFFLVSGILFFVYSMPKIVEGEKFNHFFLKKVIRLYPVLIASFIVTYILDVILYFNNGRFNGMELDLAHFLNSMIFGDVLFSSGNKINGPAWYVFVLMFVYIIAYILVRIYKKHPTKLLFIIPIFVGISFLAIPQNYILVSYSTARGLYSFFGGVLFGSLLEVILKYKEDESISYKKKNIIMISTKLFLAIELVLAIMLVFYNKNGIFIWDYNHFFLLFVFPELILLLFDINFVNKICNNKFIKFLGGMSYSIYLFDYATLILFTLCFINVPDKNIILEPFVLILIILAHLVIGAISYIFIEIPIGNRLNKYLNSNLNKNSGPLL